MGASFCILGKNLIVKKKTQLIFLFWFFSFTALWSQDFPSLSEIYDFNAGDEFHFLHFYCCNELSFQLEQLTIKDKFTDKNEIGYTVQKSIFDFIPGDPPQLVDTSVFNHSDSLFIPFPDSVIFGIHDGVETDPGNYNGRVVYIHEYPILGLLKEEKYVRGCGMVYNGWITLPDTVCEVTDSLIYYSKGSEVWGKTLLSENELSKKIPFSIFPNPTPGILNVACNDPAYSIESIRIVNIQGKVLNTKRLPQGLHNNKTCLNYSNLGKGLYFIYFSTNKGILTYKFIKN